MLCEQGGRRTVAVMDVDDKTIRYGCVDSLGRLVALRVTTCREASNDMDYDSGPTNVDLPNEPNTVPLERDGFDFTGLLQIGPPLVPLVDDDEMWFRENGEHDELVTLAAALEHLNFKQRQVAVAAHLDVLQKIVVHERQARAMADGGSDPHCAACFVEPELHAELLADAVVERSGELMDAIALYGPRILTRTR